MKVHPSSSTHRIVEVGLDRLSKDLSPGARVGSGLPRIPGIEDPTREPSAYRSLLGPARIGVRCFETGPDRVLLERIDAPALWQIGNYEIWRSVCGWLASLHGRLATSGATSSVPLLRLERRFYEAWRSRAAAAGAARKVIDAHARATEHLLSLPQTVIHGDLYPSNVLVDAGPPLRVWPIDWELIGWGPAALDLAALTSGSWSEAERTKMVAAYVAPLATTEREMIRDAIDAARLHLCVQWIGVPQEWKAPPSQAHDWNSEALDLAARL